MNGAKLMVCCDELFGGLLAFAFVIVYHLSGICCSFT